MKGTKKSKGISVYLVVVLRPSRSFVYLGRKISTDTDGVWWMSKIRRDEHLHVKNTHSNSRCNLQWQSRVTYIIWRH